MSDLTTQILIEIREAIRETNASLSSRIDQTNASLSGRIDQTNERLDRSRGAGPTTSLERLPNNQEARFW